MTDVHYAGHIAIPSSKRDPKPTPTVDGRSWWERHPTHESLGAEARERFPNATCRETFSGVLYLAAEKHGLV